MTFTQSATPAIPSTGQIKKMEDRKRALATDTDDYATSRKRLHKDENGQVMRMDADTEKEIESFQKDAILRQLKEYKKERNSLQEQYNDLQKKSRYHDDHLRTIDAWFAQMLDEVRLLIAQLPPTPPSSAIYTRGMLDEPLHQKAAQELSARVGEEMYGSALLFEDHESFAGHLKERSTGIRKVISELFSRLPSASPEVEELRKQLSDLLANEKVHIVELRGAIEQQEYLHERLESACVRYMTAEKKLERAKSLQVAKLERQATMSGAGDLASPTSGRKPGTPKVEGGEVNGDGEGGMASSEAEAARKEAIAAAQKQKAQLEEIEKENERLTNELSAARTKLASLTDDDYANTALFKSLRSQHEDVIKRINDLEATNVQLREEAQKLHAERAAYRGAVTEDGRNQTIETEAQLARTETDLARIRNARDEILSELNVRKASDTNRKLSTEQSEELAAARLSRISALESETTRLKLQLGEVAPEDVDVESLDPDALKSKLRTVQNQYTLLSNELQSMENAWRKTQTLASRKLEEIVNWEEQVARLSAEKAKADQKYFAAMKAKDLRDAECRTLKAQSARSTEIVTQLKEADGRSRELVVNLERQIAESKDGVSKLEVQCRTHEQKFKEAGIAYEGCKKQVEDLKTLIADKDKEVLSSARARREVEEALEKCKSRMEDQKLQYDNLRKIKTSTTDNDINDGWRKLAICPVCNHNIRNSALKLCGHTFCTNCVADLISNRSRKCPSCGKAFGQADKMPIVLA